MTINNEDDEYETPPKLYKSLCDKYNFFPVRDVCATELNSKCNHYLEDGLKEKWTKYNWCNPPHSMTKEFVIKAHEELSKGNYTLMIIPANSICTKYAEEYIEGYAEYHPIFGRPQFLKDGKLSKFPSRNSYFVVIWRK